jgi:GntR family transcriptional regulator / MocR family aminotransferase
VAKRARPLRIPHITLTKNSSIPLRRQLYAALRKEIIDGRMTAGQRLPSSRTLANRLPVSRNTVLDAYERLISEGYLVGRVGSGTRVARPKPETYLPELPRHTATKSKSFRRILRESFYPANTTFLQDSEGNGIYLFTGD